MTWPTVTYCSVSAAFTNWQEFGVWQRLSHQALCRRRGVSILTCYLFRKSFYWWFILISTFVHFYIFMLQSWTHSLSGGMGSWGHVRTTYSHQNIFLIIIFQPGFFVYSVCELKSFPPSSYFPCRDAHYLWFITVNLTFDQLICWLFVDNCGFYSHAKPVGPNHSCQNNSIKNTCSWKYSSLCLLNNKLNMSAYVCCPPVAINPQISGLFYLNHIFIVWCPPKMAAPFLIPWTPFKWIHHTC